MKYYFTLLLTLFLANVQAARVTPAQFVEIASKQSVLSQKIAKDYALLTYDAVAYQKSLLDLKISISYFNRNLAILKKYAVGHEKLAAAVEVQQTSWKAYTEAFQEEKTPENVVKVLKLSEVVFKASDYVLAIGAKEYRKTISNVEQGSLISVISTQSALSQRACLLFVNQKMKDKVAKKDRLDNESLLQTFSQMDESLDFIISSSLHDKADTELIVGETSVVFDRLKNAKKDFAEGKLEVKDVVGATESLSKLYDKLRYAYIHLN